MKIAISELEHLREEVKNCHKIIKNLQKKREFVGLTDEDKAQCIQATAKRGSTDELIAAIEAKLKEKNT
jgi:hypothetical protein